MDEQNDLIGEALVGLYQISHYLTTEYDLPAGVATIVLFELLADAMRAKAPMEFDAYLTVLREEIPKGRHADQERLDELRDEMRDIMEMTCTT